MLNPTICPKCFQPNEATRALCWKCLHKFDAINPEDYVRLFGLKWPWTNDDLKEKYRILARKYHPDANPGNRESEAYFKFVNQAFEVLSRLEGPPKPNTPPKPAGPSNKLEMESDNFEILDDFIKNKNTRKRVVPPPPPKGFSAWLSKILGR